nr:hypothetical protein [Jidongwangia harbinensis]
MRQHGLLQPGVDLGGPVGVFGAGVWDLEVAGGVVACGEQPAAFVGFQDDVEAVGLATKVTSSSVQACAYCGAA